MFDIQENLKKLPDSPGVYMHKDKLGQVIYVGKAVSLRNRVRQYFQKAAQTNPKVRAMVSHIAEFEYITCGTEMEALILECNLIKKYMPKYNVLLRDDKTYPYIMVTTTEDFPRVVKTRIIAKDGNKYFGPYSDAGAVNQIVDLLSDIYSLKRCSAKEFPSGHRPCLNYHIQQCRGVCAGKVTKGEYGAAIEKVLEFLGGKDKPLLKSLEEKMMAASEKMEYEEAARYRDYIISVKALSETQRVTLVSDKDIDVVLPVKDEQNSFIALFTVRDGKLSGRETFQIQTGDSDEREEMVGEFIKQYYGQ
ncbi:MAG: excinuclease ABC subunit C, partial [Clostridia bacterium]|nr:excinuclease ABC subunit C [Clostridia bacterium]